MTTLLLLVCAGVTGWLLGRRPAPPADQHTIIRHPSNRRWSPRPNLRLIEGGQLYDFDAVEHDGGGAA